MWVLTCRWLLEEDLRWACLVFCVYTATRRSSNVSAFAVGEITVTRCFPTFDMTSSNKLWLLQKHLLPQNAAEIPLVSQSLLHALFLPYWYCRIQSTHGSSVQRWKEQHRVLSTGHVSVWSVAIQIEFKALSNPWFEDVASAVEAALQRQCHLNEDDKPFIALLNGPVSVWHNPVVCLPYGAV